MIPCEECAWEVCACIALQTIPNPSFICQLIINTWQIKMVANIQDNHPAITFVAPPQSYPLIDKQCTSIYLNFIQSKLFHFCFKVIILIRTTDTELSMQHLWFKWLRHGVMLDLNTNVSFRQCLTLTCELQHSIYYPVMPFRDELQLIKIYCFRMDSRI